MKDKVFIDTNIFVYSALDDEEEKVKREKAIELLKTSKPLSLPKF